ncbi:hypothetical protein HAX54_053011, partial [Datura stramonium]|nr:hypothetical protein [Datura stramonium]
KFSALEPSSLTVLKHVYMGKKLSSLEPSSLTVLKRVYKGKEGISTIGKEHLTRSIFEEMRIIDSELFEYTEIERGYKSYRLERMSEAPGYYYPNMVREFYANYADTLDDTINGMLYEPKFMLPARTTKFDYKMREKYNQRPWLTQVLTNGQPSWIENSKEQITGKNSMPVIHFTT